MKILLIVLRITLIVFRNEWVEILQQKKKKGKREEDKEGLGHRNFDRTYSASSFFFFRKTRKVFSSVFGVLRARGHFATSLITRRPYDEIWIANI